MPAVRSFFIRHASLLRKGFVASLALFSAWSLALRWDAGDADSYASRQVIWVVVFGVCCLFFDRCLREEDRRVRAFGVGLGLIYALMETLGSAIYRTQTVATLFQGAGQCLQTLCFFLGRWALYGGFSVWLLGGLSRRTLCVPLSQGNLISPPRRSLWLLWLGIFLPSCFLYLVYFPGTLSSDPMRQIMEAMGDVSVSTHHPPLHTLLLWLFLQVGGAVGKLSVGIGLYTLFQMICMSGLYALVVWQVRRYGAPGWMWGILAAFFALFPVFPMFSVTVWKDVFFGGAVLLLTLLSLELLRERERYFLPRYRLPLLVLALLLLALMKNNGIYIAVICLLGWILGSPGCRRPLLIATVAFFVLFGLIRGPVFSALEVEEGSDREAMSIPLQQMARVVLHHSEEIAPEDREVIDALLPVEDLGALYNWTYSDPVKNEFDEAYYAENKEKVRRTFVRLMTAFPLETLDALLCGSLGYWYPEMEGWVFFSQIIDNDYGIATHSFLPGVHAFFQEHRLDSIRKIPVLSMLMNVGFVFLVLLFCAVLILVKRRGRLLLAFLPGFGLWLTALASPVNCEFRYIFGTYLSLPLLLCVTLLLPGREKR